MDIYQRKECLRVLGYIAANDDQIAYISSLAIFVYRGGGRFYLMLPYSKNRECDNGKLAEVTFRTYMATTNETDVLSLKECDFVLNSERLRKSVEDYITNEFYNRRYMSEEFVQPLISLLETTAQGDTLSLLKRQATIKLFICKSKNDITVEIKPVLTFLRLKRDVNPTIMGRFSNETIYTYDIEFTTTTFISEHFTRKAEYTLGELHMVEEEDDNAEDRFIIKDNLDTGVMSFCLKRKDHEWSSRASVVSCIPGYECASILIDNTLYHMHLKNLTQYIPDGYVLVQVHDIYDDGVEKEFSIVSVEDMKKYPDKLVPVTFDKQLKSFE